MDTDLVEFLQELVRTPSLSGNLGAAANVIEGKMCSLDFDEIWRDEYGSVIAKKSGSRPGATILFDAHMDVVQVGERSAWQHDPFGGEIAEGRLWGRGATDTKASLAGMIIGLGKLTRDRFSGTMVVAATLEEEVIEGAALSPVLDAVKPDGVVIGEPTDCRLAIGHKGRARVVVTLTGKAAHSSTPERGENAIFKAVEVVRRFRAVDPLVDELLGNSVMEPIEFLSSPYPSASTIPDGCRVVYDRRLVRGETEQTVRARYEEALHGLTGWTLSFEEICVPTYTRKELCAADFHAGWALDQNAEMVKLGLEGLIQAGLVGETYYAPFCTNGSASAGNRGIPTLVFGPSSINQAHTVDESIELGDLQRGMDGFVGLFCVLGDLKKSNL